MICDEFELYKAMQKVAHGMELLFCYLEKIGVVTNIISRENVERNVYENRFGVFGSLPFPRYKSFDDFQNERANNLIQSDKEIQDAIKAELTEGKNILAKLISTADDARSLTILPKATLEQLQRTIVMNSLSMTKATMFGKEAVAKVNLSASLFWLPLIEIDKKAPAVKV